MREVRTKFNIVNDWKNLNGKKQVKLWDFEGIAIKNNDK